MWKSRLNFNSILYFSLSNICYIQRSTIEGVWTKVDKINKEVNTYCLTIIQTFTFNHYKETFWIWYINIPDWEIKCNTKPDYICIL